MKRLLHQLFGTKNTPRLVGRRLNMQSLESRRVMTSDLMEALEPVSWQDGAAELSASLPALHSNPGASHTLYLNFLGTVTTEVWDTQPGLEGTVINPFDFDGDSSQFSGSEQAMIQQIWSIVAEDFAPFDVDVTTEYAGSFENGEALNVAIGGTDHDADFTSGIARLGSFVNDAENLSLVVATNIHKYMAIAAFRAEHGKFSSPDDQQLAAYMAGQTIYDTATAIGNTVSHEAGHAFGLDHHRDPNTGEEYFEGDDQWTPIMGYCIATDRLTWSKPQVDTRMTEAGLEEVYEDELEILTSVLGARADDHGDTQDVATAMAAIEPGLHFEQQGIIGTMGDVDAFSFQVKYSGQYDVRIDVPRFGNLDSRLAIYDNDGLVSVINIGGRLSEKTQLHFEADTDYYFLVMNHGAYGDLGQYTATVNWAVPEIDPLYPIPEFPNLPELDPSDPAPDWSDPLTGYDPATVYDPDAFEPLADLTAGIDWSSGLSDYVTENAYDPLLLEPQAELTADIDSIWEAIGAMEEAEATFEEPAASVFTPSVAYAVFAPVTSYYSVFSAVSRYSFRW